MGEVMKEATFSLAEAKFAAGDFRYVNPLPGVPDFCRVGGTYFHKFTAPTLSLH